MNDDVTTECPLVRPQTVDVIEGRSNTLTTFNGRLGLNDGAQVSCNRLGVKEYM